MKKSEPGTTPPNMRSFIVYACPLLELAAQLDYYFARSAELCGTNAAHDYMPHCSLTGFFQDERVSIPRYITALDAALQHARPSQPTSVLAIERLELGAEFHGLILNSPWLQSLIADFAQSATSPTRHDQLRLKQWLHLSLAYNFPAEQNAALAELARELVDIHAPVAWELRFYERHATHSWTCHARWGLL